MLGTMRDHAISAWKSTTRRSPSFKKVKAGSKARIVGQERTCRWSRDDSRTILGLWSIPTMRNWMLKEYMRVNEDGPVSQSLGNWVAVEQYEGTTITCRWSSAINTAILGLWLISARGLRSHLGTNRRKRKDEC
jgi:hypothetical protein